MLLFAVAMMISVLFELKGRNQDILNTQHFHTQLKSYEKSLLTLSKVCLQKYSLPQCSFLRFDLNGYEAQIVMREIGEGVVGVDILLEFINPLNGNLLRRNYREFLEVDNL